MPASEISLGVTLAVLAAGVLHAGWNALLKSAPGGDALLDTAAVVAGSALVGLCALPFVGMPDAGTWKFIVASTIIHFAYYATLVRAYQVGDLSFAYPLMRGTAPMLVTLLGIVFLGEWPSVQVAVGIALICAGIVSIAFVRRGGHPPAAAFWALTNAGIIAVYTLVDGAGARSSPNVGAYVAWLMFIEGIPFVAFVRWRRGPKATAYLRRAFARGMVGGAASAAAYGIVLWAMTRAPVAVVSALRETSVLFAALIGATFLKEGFTVPRIVGAVSVVLGIFALKL